MKKFRLLLVFALLFRIVFAFVVWHPDVNSNADWGQRYYQYGPDKFFSGDANVWNFTWPNQPPGTIYLYAGIEKVFEGIFGFFWWLNVNIPLFPSNVISYFELNLYPALLQFPGILADFGIAIIIYKMLKSKEQRTKNKENTAKFGALLFLLNPVIWYNSSVWGQTDSIISFLGLLSIYLLLKRRLAFSVLLFILSIYTKISLLIFLPVLLIVALKQKYNLFNYFWTIVSVLLIVGVATLPFSHGEPFKWLYYLYKDKVLTNQLQVITANAFNFWGGLTGLEWVSHDKLFGPLSYKVWGIILYTFTYIPILRSVWKRQDEKSVLWALALVAFSTFMLLTNMHERYLYPFFPIFTIVVAQNRKWLKFYTLVSVISLLNMYHLWFIPRSEIMISLMTANGKIIPRILSIINVGLFAYLYRHYFRLNKAVKV